MSHKCGTTCFKKLGRRAECPRYPWCKGKHGHGGGVPVRVVKGVPGARPVTHLAADNSSHWDTLCGRAKPPWKDGMTIVSQPDTRPRDEYCRSCLRVQEAQ